MLRAFLLYLSNKPRLGRTLDRVPLTRRLVRRFVAGTTAEAAFPVIERLQVADLLSAITYLGENVLTEAAARRAADVYLSLLDEIKRRDLPCVPSLKLTHLGLDLSAALCRENLERVLDRAQAAGRLCWIDMESSAYTDRTLALYEALRPRFPNAACVIQAYLRRSADDLPRLIGLGATIRLCKWAYREPPRLAFVTKREVDANYARLMDLLLTPEALARGAYPAFATHDERLIARAAGRARELGIPPEKFEIQMLYGIRHDLRTRIRDQGLRLRVLVPFGEDWYGYFVRRLAERPANLLFLLKNLVRP
ncbi:MAG: proline dehydrogenase family protein [Candidatus Rokubacteria bacterium]|nr:proline dehydrogenase family protein [Candidatus Rokubacteria bacterium]